MMAGERNHILLDARWPGEPRADASVVLVDTRTAAELRAAFERLGLRPEAEIVPYRQGGYRPANARTTS